MCTTPRPLRWPPSADGGTWWDQSPTPTHTGCSSPQTPGGPTATGYGCGSLSWPTWPPAAASRSPFATSRRAPPSGTRSSTGCSRPSRRSEEHTSELQSHLNLVCRLLLEKKKKKKWRRIYHKKKKETQQ